MLYLNFVESLSVSDLLYLDICSPQLLHDFMTIFILSRIVEIQFLLLNYYQVIEVLSICMNMHILIAR